MANKELNSQNPFERLGTYVFGERFVGRDKEVKILQENCTNRNFSIVGLPKIGKTSLAYHSIINQKASVLSEKSFYPIFFSCGTCKEPQKFFINLIKKIKSELEEGLPEKESKILERLYKNVQDSDFDECDILSFFESGLIRLSANIVVIFDEFDKVRTIGFDGTDFGMLRAILSVPNVHGVVVSKRTIYAIENWGSDSNSGPSTFYQLFQGNTIRLGQYDETSLQSYWRRLETYEDIPTIDDEYKRLAYSYVGNHPHLLDVYNSCIYDLKKNGNAGSDDIRLKVRSEMNTAFKATVEILKSEDLLDAAIQVAIGPVYNLTEDSLDKLIQYDFIKKISEREKNDLVGVLGYTFTENGKSSEVYSFLAFSHYFTILMKKEYINQIDFWKEWPDTFNSLRKIAEKFFRDNWGDEWDTAVQVRQITEMRKLRQKDYDSNIEASPLLEYLTETILRDLIKEYWHTFAPVFSPFSCDEFMIKYDYLLKIRNHHAHINAKFLSEENKIKANSFLKEIRENICCSFYDSPLRIIDTTLGYSGTYQVKEFGNYKYIKYNGENALFEIDANVKNGDCIKLLYEPIKNNNEKTSSNYPYFIFKHFFEKV